MTWLHDFSIEPKLTYFETNQSFHNSFTPCSARNNQYDGAEEFWVVTRETGKRQESHSFEETHEKNAKAMP